RPRAAPARGVVHRRRVSAAARPGRSAHRRRPPLARRLPREGRPMTPAPNAARPDSVLDLDRVTRRYGSLTAVDEVSLRLPAGARHAVIGPNGAGKTTLLNLIAGTDRPDHGTIALNGTDVTRASTAKRSRL